MKKDNLQLARSILVLGLGAAVNYLITFLITPFITEHIGIEAYGFVTLAKTVVSYAQIFTVALTSFMVRYIFTAYHSGRVEEARSYYSSSVAGCLGLSGALCAVLLLAVTQLEHLLHIPPELVQQVKLLFGLVFINFVVYTMVTPFSAYAYIVNRMDLSGLFQLIAYVTDAAVLLILFRLFTPRVWFVGMGTLTASLVLLGGSYVMTRRLAPDLRVSRRLIRFDRIKTLVVHGMWDSFNALGNVLNTGLDLLISNMLLTDVATGQISVAKTLGVMLRGAYGLIFQPFQPTLLKAYTEGDKPRLMRQIAKAMAVCGCFANVVTAGFMALGMLYFQLWMPSQDHHMLYGLTAVTLVNGLTTGMIQPVYYVYTMTVKNKLPCLVTIGGGLLNVASMFVLLSCTSLGGYAVVGTTTVIMMTLNVSFNVLYAAKCLRTSPWPMYRAMLINFVSAAAMLGLFGLVGSVMKPQGWLGLIGAAAVMAALGAPLHLALHKLLGQRKTMPV